MGYSTANQPRCVVPGVGVGPRMWFYTSTDAVTTVRVSGYFTDGYKLGMRAGDIVLVLDNDASPVTGSWCWVATATTSAVDLSDGVTITGTNSD